MDVGIIVPGFGGSDEEWCIPAISHYVRRLSKRHDVRVFALRYPHHRHPFQAHGAEVVPLGGGSCRGWSRWDLVRRAGASILREHRRRAFGVLHAFWADEPGYVATRAARKLRLPAVVSVAGGELVAMPGIGYGGRLSRWNRWFSRRALRSADIIGVGSTTTAVQVEGSHRTVSFLPLGIDPAWIGRPEPSEIPLEGEPALLYAASLTPVKDPETAIRAMALVLPESPRAVLHVVGEGPLRGELERLGFELGITNSVRFHGQIDHASIAGYYRSADLLVTSSLHEAQGMVVLEAAAAGLPTVGTGVGVLADLGTAALTVPVRDHRALADGIVALIKDPHRRRAMVAEAAKRVSEIYALDATLARFESVYQELGRGTTNARLSPHLEDAPSYGGRPSL